MKDLFNLKPKPGEQQVSASFSKYTGPESQGDSIGVRLHCRGGSSAVTKLIDALNKAIPGDEASPDPTRLPKIPHSEDELILQLRTEGKKFREIHEALTAKGIVCGLDDVTSRYQSEKKKREMAQNVEKSQQEPQSVAPPVQPDATTPPSLPGVEGAQEAARANPRGSPEEKPPAPKSISRSELDDKIWRAWKAGKSPEQISNDLYAEGLYYSENSVKRRLLQQGAEL